MVLGIVKYGMGHQGNGMVLMAYHGLGVAVCLDESFGMMMVMMMVKYGIVIQLLEFSKTSPSPPSSSPPSPSRSGYPPSISGTKCGIIDPLVSKRPENNSE